MTLPAGKLRPSQAVTQFGPGALVDLPTMSMVIAGADEWNLTQAHKIDEPRLARRLGVEIFYDPPYFHRRRGTGGIPARLFPRYLVCPRCNRLAPHEAFHFDERGKRHLCKAPSCSGKGRAVAYPSRFMVACPNGHLDDFPWHTYLHAKDVVCTEELRLEDSGQTGAITDLWVKCRKHGPPKNLGQAFGTRNRAKLGPCDGNRPWFGDRDPHRCEQELRVLLRGASNAYFPIVESAISIPPWSDPLQVAIGQFADDLAKVDTFAKLELLLGIVNWPELTTDFSPEQIWDGLERRRKGVEDLPDLRAEEWKAFQVEPTNFNAKAEFQSRTLPVPQEAAEAVGRVVALERMREVRALRGFTRIDPIPDVGDLGEVEQVQARLVGVKRTLGRWLPGVELRGEGVLLQLREDQVSRWEASAAAKNLDESHRAGQIAWFESRGVLPPEELKPARLILLHTLAHVLIRQLALDCGYSSASLRERLYSSTQSPEEMAGILVYTATPDSEGSLGGLVEMAKPDKLGPVFKRALESSRLCANDPLCADREGVMHGSSLNGAACHACLLVSETACELGNSHLDRNVLLGTLSGNDLAFFPE
jgi:hypothetical protein